MRIQKFCFQQDRTVTKAVVYIIGDPCSSYDRDTDKVTEIL